MSNLCLISAVLYEAKPTLEMLVKNHIQCDYWEIGVGPINAAKSSIALKNEMTGKNILYLGSAGSFGEFKDPYLVSVEKVSWLPTAERMGLAKNMTDLHKPVLIPRTYHFDLPKKHALTSTSVSYNAEVKVELTQKRDELIENMEAYPIVSEFETIAESIDVIMGITNAVGPNGSNEWKKNFKKIAQMTADYLEQKLCR